MIQLIMPIPRRVSVAVSGGIDSMAALDFVCRGGHDVQVLHFDHGTRHGAQAREFIEDHCRSLKLRLVVSTIQRGKGTGESQEEYWRTERMRFFTENREWGPIVTAHHLDDAVEWWIMSALHGEPRLIPRENPETGVVRPFLSTSKTELADWCMRKGVPHVEDPSNISRDHMRNVVRHDIVPHALKVNPGLSKVVRKKLLESRLHHSSQAVYL